MKHAETFLKASALSKNLADIFQKVSSTARWKWKGEQQQTQIEGLSSFHNKTA